MTQCRHKTFLDHTNDGERYPNDKLVWRCSACGMVGPWTDAWSYYGNIECLKCHTASMDWVACSDKCAEQLRKDNGVRGFASKQAGEPGPAAEADQIIKAARKQQREILRQARKQARSIMDDARKMAAQKLQTEKP